MSERSLPFYVVNAFTSSMFRGNPAAVVPLETALDDDLLLAIAAQHNLSETAYFEPRAEGTYRLRWFTPKAEGSTLRTRDPRHGLGYKDLRGDSIRRPSFRNLEWHPDGQGGRLKCPCH